MLRMLKWKIRLKHITVPLSFKRSDFSLTRWRSLNIFSLVIYIAMVLLISVKMKKKLLPSFVAEVNQVSTAGTTSGLRLSSRVCTERKITCWRERRGGGKKVADLLKS